MWSLVSEQTRENYKKKTDGPAPVIDVVRAVSIVRTSQTFASFPVKCEPQHCYKRLLNTNFSVCVDAEKLNNNNYLPVKRPLYRSLWLHAQYTGLISDWIEKLYPSKENPYLIHFRSSKAAARY